MLIKPFHIKKCESDSVYEYHQEDTHRGSLILVQINHLFASLFRNKGGGSCYVFQIRLTTKKGKITWRTVTFLVESCPMYHIFLVKFELAV